MTQVLRALFSMRSRPKVAALRGRGFRSDASSLSYERRAGYWNEVMGKFEAKRTGGALGKLKKVATCVRPQTFLRAASRKMGGQKYQVLEGRERRCLTW